MRVDRIRAEPAPGGGRVQLLAEVQYERGTPRAETCWFEVPAELAGDLSGSGNPWLACLLPVATRLGEPLHLSAPVDPVLLEGAQDLMAIWHHWYPHLRPVPIHAELALAPAPVQRREASFFSGGVDASFTVASRRWAATTQRLDGQPEEPPELLCLHGLDVPFKRPHAHARIFATAETVAAAYGFRAVRVATNLRSTRLRESHWGSHSHACVLAGAGLALEGRYHRAVISSTFDYRSLHPWGSHPLTDRLLSTSALQFEHFGSGTRRVDKIAKLVEAEELLRSVRVCYHNRDGGNCGACYKCFRTMAVLAVLDALERGTLFPPGSFSLERYARVYTPPNTTGLMAEVGEFAVERGRPEVARACARGLRLSQLMRPMVQLSDRLREQPHTSLRGRR